MMRVIAGEFRSRKLKTLEGLDTRPTPDRLREALFNVLAPRIAGAVFLDAYAGTGAVGIEALSRGAARAIFIERSRAAVNLIRENLASLDLDRRSEVFTGKALRVLERVSADIVFFDPPYATPEEWQAGLELVGSAGLVIVQHPTRHATPRNTSQLERIRVLKHGDNSLSFYEPANSSDSK
jgi:16S rRNA (guanine966-N2)-methyltransferase